MFSPTTPRWTNPPSLSFCDSTLCMSSNSCEGGAKRKCCTERCCPSSCRSLDNDHVRKSTEPAGGIRSQGVVLHDSPGLIHMPILAIDNTNSPGFVLYLWPWTSFCMRETDRSQTAPDTLQIRVWMMLAIRCCSENVSHPHYGRATYMCSCCLPPCMYCLPPVDLPQTFWQHHTRQH